MSISSPGIGSGLDITSLVTQLVAADRKPKSLSLDRKEAKLQAQLSALGTLKSGLADFQSSLSGLLAFSSVQLRTAASSNKDVVTITSTSSKAQVASYSITVADLAESHKLASSASGNTTDSITGSNGGTLTFRFGTYNGVSFTANPDKATKSVTISAANSSMQGIRDAVNTANIGVTANIIKDATGYRLVFVSKDTGAANSLELTVSDDDGNNLDNAGLSVLAYDPTAAVGNGKNLSQTVLAKDASLTIDGLSITSASNTLTNVIDGLTLNLVSKAPTTPVTVAVKQDNSELKSDVEGFVTAYNKLIDTINSLSSYNKDTKTSGTLLGDSTLRAVSSQIRNIISSTVSGLSGKYMALADIGITSQLDGKLNTDSAKLSAALDASPDAVAKIFSAAAQASDLLISANDPGSKAVAGSYPVTISQLGTRGGYTGAATAAFPLLVDANNNNFVIKVDGITSGSMALTQKSYATSTELATEIQARINGDSTLSSAGVSVAVSYNVDHFEITSNRYGSASAVEFTSIDTNTTTSLGFSVGAGTPGVDVAGTVGGETATGSGQTLSGNGLSTTGLSLLVNGGALGGRGNVTVSRGIADRINSLLTSLLDSKGILDSRTDNLNERIDDISTQREELDLRSSRLQQRLFTQYNALDSLLVSLQGTGNYLIQQLNTLNSFNNNLNSNR
ncbi:MAG: hypothetical protein A2V90_09920 [Gammaproteobacteria bacterium RBG_16_57_12]|nr:MAG: hypothetical protein A2V90_09920 [Gammaproteobacteria bacterium RBG_16_57_12]